MGMVNKKGSGGEKREKSRKKLSVLLPRPLLPWSLHLAQELTANKQGTKKFVHAFPLEQKNSNRVRQKKQAGKKIKEGPDDILLEEGNSEEALWLEVEWWHQQQQQQQHYDRKRKKIRDKKTRRGSRV